MRKERSRCARISPVPQLFTTREGKEGPEDALLQGWVGKPHLVRSPSADTKGGNRLPEPGVTPRQRGTRVRCRGAAQPPAPFPSWEAPRTVLLPRAKPGGALGGPEQDPLRLGKRPLSVRCCRDQNLRFWVYTSPKAFGCQWKETRVSTSYKTYLLVCD